ncbi:hypothetical protein CB0940_11913 [Cercospora beticola]|uniref:Major facilitator superfamily transporter n=1 Tax=Cercospora beticola TaxID=122368 RepID=A0A2G5IDX2_CERBT|nr:hypothetical protein CB0940_11913 [Cercospora beticola]PIB03047.1 hypothetical protein CB0940_11913 [Cercospora beticola]WPB04273.1 hypothetical protein RHO25_008918 [Cercospora beticola]
MRSVPRLTTWNPLRIFSKHSFAYQQIPSLSADSINIAALDWPQGGIPWRDGARRRWGIGRISLTRSVYLALAALFMLALLGGGGYHQHRKWSLKNENNDVPFEWMHYARLNGFYNGIRTLVPYSQWQPENAYNKSAPNTYVSPEELGRQRLSPEPPIDPVKFDPYKNIQGIQTCYVDEEETIEVPDVYAYPGVPQHMAEPFYGDYDTLGLNDGVCFERFGRYGPYGYGYNETMGGMGPGASAESAGSEKVFEQMGYVNYDNVDWGSAQERCYEKNKARFKDDPISGRKKKSRQAYVLRTWTGYEYQPHQIIAMRAMISELNLKSGGEYDVHLLVHVKDDSIPIWADERVYQQIVEQNVPQEFWGIATLWSEKQMEMYYPEPFPDNFANMAGSSIHGVYRSAHFALQWFSQQHPEYDFFWNWEMDIRYTGHYYQFNEKITEWARKQPRKGMWERSSRFYIPKYHGTWDNFTKFVENEVEYVDKPKNNPTDSGPIPVWGPVRDFPNGGMLDPPEGVTPLISYEMDNYDWGTDEEADIITFNPIFDPSQTNWVFSWDITGYRRDLPPPPRRCAIVTVARLSKRLLDIAHHETWRFRHTMFPEMWPPSVALHHGLKAVYAPHPVYFDRDWDLEYMNQVFNYPKNLWDSPFGWGEHNMLGSSFYYNSGFSGALWRRWLGQYENGEGGKRQEEEGTGRMCLRGVLHHPIKHENSPPGS